MRKSHARIQAVITGTAGRSGPIESHERNVLAITRRIHSLERRRSALKAQAAAVVSELKARRRELRAVLQRDSSVSTEDDLRLVVAGKADAIDGTTANAGAAPVVVAPAGADATFSAEPDKDIPF